MKLKYCTTKLHELFHKTILFSWDNTKNIASKSSFCDVNLILIEMISIYKCSGKFLNWLQRS